MSGTLYIVATPIGNLDDITGRALDVLRSVSVIACEDTRVTAKLLARYEIKKELTSYHQHSKSSKTEKIIEVILGGKDVALVSDAGTPGMSDPGRELIRAAVESGVPIVPIPGASSLATALSVSAFDLHQFMFMGFLPHKKGRQTKLREIADSRVPVVLFESVYRIKKLMGEIVEYCGDREVEVGRELTKKFETVYRGLASQVADQVTEKGEFIVIIGTHDKK